MNIKAINKEILRNFDILDKYEAGVILTGPEVKSIKQGKINLKGSYVRLSRDGNLHLIGVHIAPYKPAGNAKTYNPTRSRKLLLNKREINNLSAKLRQKGLTVATTKVYTKKGLIKFEIALLKGLKKHDKRAKIKKRDIDRDLAREIRAKL